MLRRLIWFAALVLTFGAGFTARSLVLTGAAQETAQPQVVSLSEITSASLEQLGPGVKGKGLAKTPSGDVGIIEVTNVPKHRHNTMDELLYILDGTATATIAGKDYTIKQGDLVVLPHGTPHEVKGTLRLLAISYPKQDPKDMEMMSGH
ncbi:MAG: cupin domain-containing protein [Vulcanimicrobiaceae bacterium]